MVDLLGGAALKHKFNTPFSARGHHRILFLNPVICAT
jgi:hypothetical protein